MAARVGTIQEPMVFGKSPVVTKARAALSQEARILAALGLVCGPLPGVTIKWLTNYHAYLVANLRLPFEARCPEESGLIRPWTAIVTVEELLPPTDELSVADTGLLCKASHGATTIDVPFIDLEVEAGHRNAQLIEDYWYWFWNWRFDPHI